MNHDLQINQNAEQTYHSIRNSIVSAQHRLSAAVNSTMVITYWEIGEQIYKACGENDRAEYGKKLLQYLSEQLTAEFGKGFSVQGLRNMRQFYCTFPIRSTLWSELSWSHYRLLMAEIAVLRTHIINYAKTREVYAAYRKAGYSKKFLAEHEADILLHKAAKQAFDDLGIKKLPTVKSLQAEYAQLLEGKKKRLGLV